MAGIKGGMKRGYYVKGHFVAEGSEMDIELKTEQMGSKTRAKAADSAKQDLGAVLMSLPPKRWAAFGLPEILIDALAEAKRITDFEGKRRQMQYIGKLMRKVDADALATALELDDVAHRHPELVAPKPQRAWTQRLLAEDAALQTLIAELPAVDVQQLRSLLRQAKKLQTSARELQNAQPPQPDKAYAEHQASKRAVKKLERYLAQVLGADDEPEDGDDGEGAEA